MSKTQKNTVFNETSEIIKLKVDGVDLAVNTIKEDESDDRVSLLCPFPALEVEIPVCLSTGSTGQMKRGVLQRIGVEEDRETGLPKLKLSIHTRDSCPPALKENLPAEKETVNPTEEIHINEDDLLSSALYDDDYVALDSSINFNGSDPAWTEDAEMPSPNVFMAHVKTRRRYRMAKKAACLSLLAVLVIGGYISERVGLFEIKQVRSYISGFSFDNIILGTPDDTTQINYDDPVQPQLELAQLELVKEIEAKELETELKRQIPIEPDELPAANPTVVPASLEQKENTKGETISENEGSAQQNSYQPDSPIPSNQVTLLLPTRWPAEYSTSYRVRDPAGIVVDVPGGLVKKEGWLYHLNKHPMIRSVKAIQRKSGARFIVFVHGELPNFMTNPWARGVTLKLYHNTEESGSDQVATLD